MKELPLSFTKELTARALAKLAKCSVPTCYRRLAAMRTAGAVISESKVTTGKTGPVPKRYRLIKAAP